MSKQFEEKIDRISFRNKLEFVFSTIFFWREISLNSTKELKMKKVNQIEKGNKELLLLNSNFGLIVDREKEFQLNKKGQDQK